MSNIAKFHKQTFLNKTTGELKIFSYTVSVKKQLVEEAQLQDVKLNMYVKDNKIIIEREENETNNC